MAPLYWSFHIMVGLGLFFIVLTATFFVLPARRRLDTAIYTVLLVIEMKLMLCSACLFSILFSIY